MAQSYAVLTNGTSAASFADGAGGATWYKIESNWVPRVANKRKSQLGGRGPYEDVDETIPISVGGSNAAHMYSNISTLKAILDQADDWYQGAAVSACSFLYSPTHATISSAASPLQAVVWNTGLELSEDFDVQNSASGARTWMMGAQLRFRRGGLWLHAASTASSASAANGDVATVSLGGASTYPSPTKIALTNFGTGGTIDATGWFQAAYVLTAESSSDVLVYNAEGMAIDQFTSVSGSANNARNGSVLRFTPLTTIENTCSASTGLSGFSSSSKITGVFVNFRNSTTVDFRVRVGVSSNSSLISWTNYYTVSPNNTGVQYARWAFLGLVSQSGSINTLYLGVTAGSASSNLEIDTIVLVDTKTVNITQLLSATENDMSVSLGYGTDITETLTLDHNTLEATHPDAIVGTRSVPYTGSCIISTRAASLTCVLLGTGNGDSSSLYRWRQYDTGAVLNNTWTATRFVGYPTPV